MVQAWQNTYKYIHHKILERYVLQTELKFTHDSIIYKTYNIVNRSLNKEKSTTTLAFTSSEFSWPVRPVYPTSWTGLLSSEASTGQTGPTNRSDRSMQNRKTEHSALKGSTQKSPNLRVSLHHLPPLCISADEFNAVGAEIDVRVSWNNNCGNKPWVY